MFKNTRSILQVSWDSHFHLTMQISSVSTISLWLWRLPELCSNDFPIEWFLQKFNICTNKFSAFWRIVAVSSAYIHMHPEIHAHTYLALSHSIINRNFCPSLPHPPMLTLVAWQLLWWRAEYKAIAALLKFNNHFPRRRHTHTNRKNMKFKSVLRTRQDNWKPWTELWAGLGKYYIDGIHWLSLFKNTM